MSWLHRDFGADQPGIGYPSFVMGIEPIVIAAETILIE